MSFEFPKIYNFPPFYTKQPNEQTWAAQRSQWISLIHSFCAHQRIWILNTRGVALSRGDIESFEDDQSEQQTELFHNTRIDRRLDPQVAATLFEEMVGKGEAQWVNAQDHSQIYVYWHTPADWAAKILEWVEATGQNGTVFTLYEISQGDLSMKQEFHGIHPVILESALRVLVKRGRAQLMKDEDGKVAGVKIQ